MAISISSPSFWISAGRPSCIRSRIATALFSHMVRSHSSIALCASVAFWGGTSFCVDFPSARRNGLSGDVAGGRCAMASTARLYDCYHCWVYGLWWIYTAETEPTVFSRMRSKGSRFTLGVWGLRVCSLDVASASEPSATVRNRPQPSATARAIPVWPCLWEVLQRLSFLAVSDVSLLRFAWQAWHFVHSHVFWNVSKVVLRGRRNTFATLSEDVLQFSWQAQHFGRVHRHFSWQAQHFRRVVLRVFCKSHWQGCVKWRQGANSVAVVAFCAMC